MHALSLDTSHGVGVYIQALTPEWVSCSQVLPLTTQRAHLHKTPAAQLLLRGHLILA